jgi:hypothetical protein
MFVRDLIRETASSIEVLMSWLYLVTCSQRYPCVSLCRVIRVVHDGELASWRAVVVLEWFSPSFNSVTVVVCKEDGGNVGAGVHHVSECRTLLS